MPGTETEEAQSVRYWLTDKGWAAAQAATEDDQEDDQ